MAAWKPKEKQLTQEEAVAAARKELAPYWYGSSPMFAGLKTGDAYSAIPLDPEFAKKSWLIFFVHPTDFSGETTLAYVREWQTRYESLGLGFLVVFRPRYQGFRQGELVEQTIRRHGLQCPVTVDAEGLLSAAFRVNEFPKVLLYSDGKFILERHGKGWMADVELGVQKFLRSDDPGLPLLPVYEPATSLSWDAGGLEFGKILGAGSKLKNGSFRIKGHWGQDAERIFTQDPKAEISFLMPGPRLSFVAATTSKISETARVVIEVGGNPVYESIASEAISMDEDGRSQVRIDQLKLYHVLESVPSKDREVSLTFPYADRVGVALYGIRFGD